MNVGCLEVWCVFLNAITEFVFVCYCLSLNLMNQESMCDKTSCFVRTDCVHKCFKVAPTGCWAAFGMACVDVLTRSSTRCNLPTMLVLRSMRVETCVWVTLKV